MTTTETFAAPPAPQPTPPQPLEETERSGKVVEFYAASVQAWYATAMEYDRSLVTLSAAAIGLITGLATTGATEVSPIQATAITGALAFFCITLTCALSVFRLNKVYLQDMVNPGTTPRKPHAALHALDWVAMASFLIAALLTISVAVSFIHSKVKVPEMSKETKSVPTFDSVLNAANLHPDFGKSFAGAANMQPAPLNAPRAPAPAPTPASSAAAPTTAGAQTNPGKQP
ncbi:hypothetical protein [Variovorax guangxiensis]|uniref:Uncharacterized protein n=1 Tax=Variovorax guangxiensis TaxID=1775474 RepID=A0A840G2I1_9BURK|nr:hypothetical protein [Variovorax guangxiensis]MBB4225507.1 hypothetical protein [Variovorax guangxiensis]